MPRRRSREGHPQAARAEPFQKVEVYETEGSGPDARDRGSIIMLTERPNFLIPRDARAPGAVRAPGAGAC